MINKASDYLNASGRIVIKLGSALFFDEANKFNQKWLQSFCQDVLLLKKQNKEIIIVASGAINFGLRKLNKERDDHDLNLLQAAASIGQIELIGAFKSIFDDADIPTAQVLLTSDDCDNRRRHLNSLNTMSKLLSENAIPVINENDTVATEEIKFGDNDRLAAKVAQMISADILVLFSNIKGLCLIENGQLNEDKIISEINRIDQDIENLVLAQKTKGSAGGMKTKIDAAKIATQSGVHMIIADGRSEFPLSALLNGGECTLFKANTTPLRAKKQWILSAINIKGEVRIDEGAWHALQNGKSLLPSGILDCDGSFDKGAIVNIINDHGQIIARGITSYSIADLKKIKGQQTSAIHSILGFAANSEVIHRDNLAIIG